jgi:hypothetical protein
VKRVWKITSRCTLKSGDVLKSVDIVAVNGGMLTAAEYVKTRLLRMRMHDRNGEWSSIIKGEPETVEHVADLTL